MGQSVQVQILTSGRGVVHVDGAQLENNPYANAYNMLDNGNFERGLDGWTFDEGTAYYSTDEHFNMSKSLLLKGDIDSPRKIYQTPSVCTSRSTRETFTLSGWAKGYGLPKRDPEDRVDEANTPKFELRAEIIYTDNSIQPVPAAFSPCMEDWQFASVQFAKNDHKTIQAIRIYCDYSYNSGNACFDDIQLVRNSLEKGLTSSDFNGSETGDDSVEETTSDDETVDTTPTFEEAKDAFGNALTETTFTDGEFGTIYRAFKFNADDADMTGDDSGNNLIEETDARGNKTTYTVNSDTSRNEEVIDRLGNKTVYEYDTSGRTTKVTNKLYAEETEELKNPTVSYSYDTFDNMTEIVRGDGMKYVLAYNAFHNLESIGIDKKDEPLIQYTYKNGNGRLKEMTYANGHTMKAVYNSIGQMVAEKWFDKEGVETAHYKYVYDGEGNIVRSIDIFAKKEYNYEYEEGRIVRATELDITLSGELVTGKTLVNSVRYYYDADGNLTRKRIEPFGGSAQTIYYETNDDNTTVKFYTGNRYVTSHSKSDSFGRKVFDELQLGTDFVTRQFTYHAGEVTEEHKTEVKVKSSTTTQLVSQIILSDGRTLTYNYDEEERIVSVADSFEGTTTYTYDALGQLKTETQGGKTTRFDYDNYGNIVAKGVVDDNGEFVEETKITYEYGNEIWRDLLTSYNGQAITYDKQGNPEVYLGHNLTWEKGRQLKSFDDNTYTYNANGIRTSKTVDGVLHTYTLDGTKILRETWDGNTLVPLYDNEDNVCGILYNGIPYYFVKNLQGDVIAIVDKDAEPVARYTYDAWGKVLATTDANGVDVPSDVTHIANINPFRYRGYYYDREIGLYYLQSRYYDAIIGRFINSDDMEYLGNSGTVIGYHLFSYGDNSVVNHSDYSGCSWIGDKLDAIKEYIKNAKQTISDTLNTVVQNGKEIVSNAKKTLTGFANKVTTWMSNKVVIYQSVVSGLGLNLCLKPFIADGIGRPVTYAWEKYNNFLIPFCRRSYQEVALKYVSHDVLWETVIKEGFWETFCKKWCYETIIIIVTKNKVVQLWNGLKEKVDDVIDSITVTKILSWLLKIRDDTCFMPISFKASLENLKYNRSLWTSTEQVHYIDNQSHCDSESPCCCDSTSSCCCDSEEMKLTHTPIYEMKLGEWSISYCGCEVLAIYNAMIRYGMPIELPDLIFWVERSGAVVKRGEWGTNPFAIDDILDYMEVPYTYFDSVEKMNQSMSDGNTYILSLWNVANNPRSQVHTYMVECNSNNATPSTTCLITHNRPLNASTERTESFSDFTNLLECGCDSGVSEFICGYLIGETNK